MVAVESPLFIGLSEDVRSGRDQGVFAGDREARESVQSHATAEAEEKHVHDVMTEIDQTDWSKTCGHVQKIEQEYCRADCILDEHPPVVINLDSDNSDTDSETDEED